MEWIDKAIVVSTRRHGESGAIVEALTKSHGRHMGLVRGGAGKKARSIYQPGNTLTLQWRARLSEHLGNFGAELIRARTGELIDDGDALTGLNALTSLIGAALPEREAHPGVFDATEILLDAMQSGDFEHWAPLYVRWEVGLLEALGFGLDLSQCAQSGTRDDLRFVSPRSGRAVSAEAGAAYASRLFALPQFLLGSQSSRISRTDILSGLRLTSHFLRVRVLEPHHRRLPSSRIRLDEIAAADSHRTRGRSAGARR